MEASDPIALLETFKKCRRRADGTVDTATLVHWLRLEVGASQFVQILEGLGKTSYTQDEFERLVTSEIMKAESDHRAAAIYKWQSKKQMRQMSSEIPKGKAYRARKSPLCQSPPRENLTEEEPAVPHHDSNITGNKDEENEDVAAVTRDHQHHHYPLNSGDVEAEERKESATRSRHRTINSSPRRSNSPREGRNLSPHSSHTHHIKTHVDCFKTGASRHKTKGAEKANRFAHADVPRADKRVAYDCSSCSSGQWESCSSSSDDERDRAYAYRRHRNRNYHHYPHGSHSKRRDHYQGRSPPSSYSDHPFVSPQLTQSIRDFFRLGGKNTSRAASKYYRRSHEPAHSALDNRRGRSSRKSIRWGREQQKMEEEEDDDEEEEGEHTTIISKRGHETWAEALAKSRLEVDGLPDDRTFYRGNQGSASPLRSPARKHRPARDAVYSPSYTESNVSRQDLEVERRRAADSSPRRKGRGSFSWNRNYSLSKRQGSRSKQHCSLQANQDEGTPEDKHRESCAWSNVLRKEARTGHFEESLSWGGMLVPRDSNSSSLPTGNTYWRKGAIGDRNKDTRPVDPALRSVMEGLDQLSGTARPHLQSLLQMAQDQAMSALANNNRAQNRVLLEGNMELWSPSRSLGGLLMSWVPFHLVLYAGSQEIRFYQSSVPAAWGCIPLHEKGALDLRLLEKIECPSDAQWAGRRFDLIVRASSGAALDAKYPGLSVFPGDEDRATYTARYNFRAPSAQSRLLWVSLITALLDSCTAASSAQSSQAAENRIFAPASASAPRNPATHLLPFSETRECTKNTQSHSFHTPAEPAAAMSATSSAVLANGAHMSNEGELLCEGPRTMPDRTSTQSIPVSKSQSRLGGNTRTRSTRQMSTSFLATPHPEAKPPVGGR